MNAYAIQDDEARKAARARRAKVRAKVLAAVGVVLLTGPLLGALWLQFVPLDGYIPEARQALSARLNQPTSITTLRYVLLPTPRVVLEGVTVGDGIRVERIEAPALATSLSTLPRVFERVEAYGVSIAPEALGTLASWTRTRSGDAIELKRLQLTDVKVNAEDSGLPAMSGELTFESNGSLRQAHLAADRLKLEITPQQNGFALAFTAQESRIPFGPAVIFTELTIRGVAQGQQFTSHEVSGRLGGGSLAATVNASWEGPLNVGGEFRLQKARLQELTPFVGSDFVARGLLSANGRYAFRKQATDTLMAKPAIEAVFVLSRGELTNLDLLRANQSSGSSSFAGGRTMFEELKGSMQIAGGQQNYRLQLYSGPLTANATIVLNPAGALSGRVVTEFARGPDITRTALKVAGTTKEPQLLQ